MINKVAIVTGSSKGIGKAIVLAFARSKEYSGIVINARRTEEAQNVSREIMDSYSKWCTSLAAEADVSKETDCIRLIHETIDRFGRIDVLVNNAGIQEDIPFTETTVEEWYKIIGVDLRPICMQQRSSQANAKAGESQRWLHNKHFISPSANTKTPLYPLCNIQGGYWDDDKNHGSRAGQK